MKKNQKSPVNYEETKEKALRLLEFRNHSEKELLRKLTSVGADRQDIEKTMDFLKEYHLVNDREYARSLAVDLQNLKKYGKFRIKSELFAKGIDTEIVEEIMAELPDDDENGLTDLVKKRLKGDFDRKNKDRVIRYFIYRGYSADEIRRCIDVLESADRQEF